ncbi:MAG: hypothetical protein OEV44_00875 [Spirochaetota bacterium]|nr:hypothetical protein [Spirochaetota bacterium]
MGIFRKKKTSKIEDTEENKGNTKDEKKNYPYRVYIKDIHGSSTKKITHYGVQRLIDEDNSTVWLFNPDTKFKEMMPEDTDDFKIYQINEVKIKILETEKALAKELKKDDPEINKKNLEYDLRLYKNRLRSLELQGRGSYMNYDEDGVPYFVFRRKGNFKFPEFDNIDLDTIYTPSESKIKKASDLLDMKKEKYSKFAKNLMTINMTLFICLILFLGGLVWWSFKLNALSNESAVTQLQNRIDETSLYCAEKYGQAGQNFYDSSVYVKNITETIVTDLHKETVIFDGVAPK